MSTSPGVADRSTRGTLRFTGEQARWFCDQLLTNQVLTLEPGTGAEALLLTPRGRITALLRLVFIGEGLLADTEPGLAPALLTFFNGRVFSTRVAIEDTSGDRGLISVVGEGADAVVAALGLPLPTGAEYANVTDGPVTVVRVVRPESGLDLLLPAAGVPAAMASLQAAGAVPLTDDDYEQRRVRGGVARDRVDIDDTQLPQEAALERAVHFAKGCYLGQEAVAMTQRGRIKRRLRHLHFAGPGTPGLGPIVEEGVDVGQLTSVVADGEQAWGIGMVKTAVPLGATVLAGGREAVVAELPGSVPGPAVPSARELRERLSGAPPPR